MAKITRKNLEVLPNSTKQQLNDFGLHLGKDTIVVHDRNDRGQRTTVIYGSGLSVYQNMAYDENSASLDKTVSMKDQTQAEATQGKALELTSGNHLPNPSIEHHQIDFEAESQKLMMELNSLKDARNKLNVASRIDSQTAEAKILRANIHKQSELLQRRCRELSRHILSLKKKTKRSRIRRMRRSFRQNLSDNQQPLRTHSCSESSTFSFQKSDQFSTGVDSNTNLNINLSGIDFEKCKSQPRQLRFCNDPPSDQRRQRLSQVDMCPVRETGSNCKENWNDALVSSVHSQKNSNSQITRENPPLHQVHNMFQPRPVVEMESQQDINLFTANKLPEFVHPDRLKDFEGILQGPAQRKISQGPSRNCLQAQTVHSRKRILGFEGGKGTDPSSSLKSSPEGTVFQFRNSVHIPRNRQQYASFLVSESDASLTAGMNEKGQKMCSFRQNTVMDAMRSPPHEIPRDQTKAKFQTERKELALNHNFRYHPRGKTQQSHSGVLDYAVPIKIEEPFDMNGVS